MNITLNMNDFISVLSKHGDEEMVVNILTTLTARGCITTEDARYMMDMYYQEFSYCNHCNMKLMKSEDPVFCSGTCENCDNGSERCCMCRKKVKPQ
jgi:hypothetical protein